MLCPSAQHWQPWSYFRPYWTFIFRCLPNLRFKHLEFLPHTFIYHSRFKWLTSQIAEPQKLRFYSKFIQVNNICTEKNIQLDLTWLTIFYGMDTEIKLMQVLRYFYKPKIKKNIYLVNFCKVEDQKIKCFFLYAFPSQTVWR